MWVFDGDLTAQRIQELVDQPAAVGRQPVPHHEQGRSHMPKEMSQEEDRLFLSYGFVEDLEVEVPDCHPGSHANGLPVEVVLEDRGLPSRSPGATPMWPLAQPAFVDEDDGAPFFLGFFLITGQISGVTGNIINCRMSAPRISGTSMTGPVTHSGAYDADLV